MLTVVTFRWKPHRLYRTAFGPETVNTLMRMVRRHYQAPHRFMVVTDDPKGIDPCIECIPLWDDYATVPNPSDHRGPSCYRRLKIFGEEARAMFGDRFVCLDLDTVITGDMSPVWDVPEDFKIWGDTNPTSPYNGSMILMTAGARKKVWETFNNVTSPIRSQEKGYFGSDQAWIGYCLGPDEKIWTRRDGVYSFRNDIQPKSGKLPENARIVFFHGRFNPWDAEVQQIPWVREHYR